MKHMYMCFPATSETTDNITQIQESEDQMTAECCTHFLMTSNHVGIAPAQMHAFHWDWGRDLQDH